MANTDRERAAETANLLENLRQVSAALWNTRGGPSSQQFADLLEEREQIIRALPKSARLSAEQKRIVSAVLSGDRYLMRQIESESAFVTQRLKAVSLRKRAANGYGNCGSAAVNKIA